MPQDRVAAGNGWVDETASLLTRERLLDAAEALFAEYGYRGASLRQITASARANLAAVNYHFGSKQALYATVFTRRVRPMNAERLRLLDAAERGHSSESLSLAGVLDILLRPIVELATTRGDKAHPFARFMSRNLIEPQPFMREVIARELGPIFMRVEPHLRLALPHLDPVTLHFRLRFVLGATNMTFAAVPFLPGMQIQFGMSGSSDELLQHLLLVSEAVLRAPLPS